jgi:hypothetical protein
MTLIKNKVDALFHKVLLQPDGQCENPVTGGRFMKGETGEDSIAYQKHTAEEALLAQEWFAVYGPPNAPLLPLLPGDWDRMRYGGTVGLDVLIGFYARSLNFQGWKVHNHPTFEDFARGLMTFPDIRSRAGQDPLVAERYPPRVLVGMHNGAFWEPPAAAAINRGPVKPPSQSMRVPRCHSSNA